LCCLTKLYTLVLIHNSSPPDYVPPGMLGAGAAPLEITPVDGEEVSPETEEEKRKARRRDRKKKKKPGPDGEPVVEEDLL